MTRPIALVTGATRGIGRAVVDILAPDHHVLVGGRDAAAVDEIVTQLPSGAPFVADLTDADAVASACEGIDRLDVVVHSAGVEMGGEQADLSREDWGRVLELNVIALADLNRQLTPALRAAKGLVVAINSGSGFTSRAGGGAYAASKFALRAWTDALREEEREHGVRVSSVHPGRVDTEMQQRIQNLGDDYDGSLYLRPESVAKAVRFVVDATEDAVVEEVSIRPRG
ncbi:SDR family oxidoreductase [Aestuariimicrobium sp. p3-SID1156]|uniref:SDR family oxidoreductase n=1 Tax=Aestuariimicrobium sp. p3-SID1156 TaxID=2916038 RepID=UPI00223AF0E3|nr:SDR family oxidoreductase [Aestuariimicrobium sp. p3-SID1156]MCT1458609.1 SDR family oxidoreductase [Aestuariimicrobium sp. p3-SID1156]